MPPRGPRLLVLALAVRGAGSLASAGAAEAVGLGERFMLAAAVAERVRRRRRAELEMLGVDEGVVGASRRLHREPPNPSRPQIAFRPSSDLSRHFDKASATSSILRGRCERGEVAIFAKMNLRRRILENM